MKTYTTKPNDSLADIAKKFVVKDEYYLKTYHNLNCPEKEIIRKELPVGTTLMIPDDPQFLVSTEEIKPTANQVYSPSFMIENEDDVTSMNGYDDETEEASENESQQEQSPKEEKQSESPSSEHEGKYFVIQKGLCQCNQGFKFPKFKVTSHQKHYWNDANAESDYLAATEDDLTLDPPAMPFGNCKLRPSSGGYLPCVYTPSGKWQKPYEKTKVMGKSCLTEISELMCATGGKITILKHGQQSEAGKSHVRKANPQEQHIYNPIVDFEEFRDETIGTEGEAW